MAREAVPPCPMRPADNTSGRKNILIGYQINPNVMPATCREQNAEPWHGYTPQRPMKRETPSDIVGAPTDERTIRVRGLSSVDRANVRVSLACDPFS